MYSEEIEKLLRENNNVISFDQYYYAFNPEVTTQIEVISYDCSKDSLYVLTNDHHLFHFRVEKNMNPKEKVKK